MPAIISYVFGMTKEKRKRGRPSKPAGEKRGERIIFRISKEESEVFANAAAANNQMSLSEWLRQAAWLVVNKHDGNVLS
jgi:predicted HicB family RNase H-like nuclease